MSVQDKKIEVTYGTHPYALLYEVVLVALQLVLQTGALSFVLLVFLFHPCLVSLAVEITTS